MQKIHLYDKIYSPFVTEKSTSLSEQNKIVFKVPKKANKKSLKRNIEKILDDNKAQNITCINLQKKSFIADYMVIASGTSSRHLQALSENLLEELKFSNCENTNNCIAKKYIRILSTVVEKINTNGNENNIINENAE